MPWYRVIKSVNGQRHVYEERTWRPNGRVRTNSRYIRPAQPGEDPVGPQKPRRILYHGSRNGIEGLPRPSENATFGPGFYLALQADAEQYARFDPDQVPWDGKRAAQYQGTVYAFDVSALDLLRIDSSDAYTVLIDRTAGGNKGYITPQDKIAAQLHWAEQGYDGLDILGATKSAVVVFPSAAHKLGDLVAYYRVTAESSKPKLKAVSLDEVS